MYGLGSRIAKKEVYIFDMKNCILCALCAALLGFRYYILVAVL